MSAPLNKLLVQERTHLLFRQWSKARPSICRVIQLVQVRQVQLMFLNYDAKTFEVFRSRQA